MKRILFLFVLIVSSWSCFAVVNMKNANFSDTWVDLSIPSSGYDLDIERTYNSRTLHNGLFGFGWCSDFETKLKVTPDGNINIIECGGGSKVVYISEKFKERNLLPLIDRVVSELPLIDPDISEEKMKELPESLLYDTRILEEYSEKLGIFGQIDTNTKYFANDRQDEFIETDGKFFTRHLSDGTFEEFDLKGQLLRRYDRNGNFQKYNFVSGRLVSVENSLGRSLTFEYEEEIGKIIEVNGPDDMSVSYEYSGDNLAIVRNSWGNVYEYTYDELHNIVELKFPDDTNKELTYDTEKDWVMSFKGRDGCLEEYEYESDPEDPFNHYWSYVTETCNGNVVNSSKYEFFHKVDSEGNNWLHQAISVKNGFETLVEYHPRFAKPIFRAKGGFETRYTYYPSGRLRKKIQNNVEDIFEYQNLCGKVSQITRKNLNSEIGDTVPVKRVWFKYDQRTCNLEIARTNQGQVIHLVYDNSGRIRELIDSQERRVLISYEEQFGKPSTISIPGLGEMTVTYLSNGEVENVNSVEGSSVAIRVANIFNELLEIISPATDSISM